MLTLFIIVSLLSAVRTIDSPVPETYITWQPEANVRGTWSILSSCVVTLVLCSYTALHMDIQHARAPGREYRSALISWVLMGIFAPEMVVCMAWCEWSEARHLTNELRKLHKNSSSEDGRIPLMAGPGRKRGHEDELLSSWTLQHSFFVIMGGYQFNPDEVQVTDSLNKVPNSIITAPVVLELVRRGHADKFPLLSASDLADRSKADNLAKTLSCLQGLWLVVQLFGRVTSRLVITELEVNTFAHVLCVIATYAFWMQKPLNVKIPVYVSSKGLESWLLMHSELDKITAGDLSRLRPNNDTENTEELIATHEHFRNGFGFGCERCDHAMSLREVQTANILKLGYQVWTLADDVIKSLLSSNRAGYAFDCVVYSDTHSPLLLDPSFSAHGGDVNVVRVDNQKQLDLFLQFWNLSDRDEMIEQYNPDARPSYQTDPLSESGPKKRIEVLTMLTISSCYGALHATLWNHHFPTTVERWLWRISSSVVAGSGIFTAIICALVWLLKRDTSSKIKRLFGGHDVLKAFRAPFQLVVKITWESNGTFIVWSRVAIVILAMTIAFCCRVFLFIEAFISLRSQPPSVYETPRWTKWFVHL